jgi:NTP pyrophosphatase (non-canonical NTP hydrolase)
MKLKEYQKIALERLNPNIANPNKESMRYCCMGLLEETGEVVSELRKPLYKGNFHEKPLDKQEITSELGDLIWYMALICKNNNIDISEISRKSSEEESEEDRKEIIKNSIKLGKQSGKIVESYLKYYKKNIEKEQLKKDLRKQYKNIVKLASELNISINDILEKNIEKITSRYKKDGQANREGDDHSERE